MGRGQLPHPIQPAAILLTLLIIAGGGSAGDTASMSGASADSPPRPVYGVQIDPDNVLLQVDLRPDGTGEWRIEYRLRLDDENATEAFERHRDRIEANPDTYQERFATDMRATIDTAANATGRDMALENVTVDAGKERLPQRYGVIVYTFEWLGFAATNDSRIEAGDALEGLYLDGETTLIVTWPDGFDRTSAVPAPTDVRERGVVWSGPLHFAADEPAIHLTQQPPSGTPPTTGSQGTVTDPEAGVDTPSNRSGNRGIGGNRPTEGGEWPPAIPMLIGLVSILLLAVLGAVYGGYLDLPVRTETSEQSKETALPSELLSNEEQVLTLLEQRGGRLKQQEVAAALDWTDPKTSKVIRQLRDDETIETFRLGRENVVTLPETDLYDSDS